VPEPIYDGSNMPDRLARWAAWLPTIGKRMIIEDNSDDPNDPIIRVVDKDEDGND
jgi:hypothetical protein